MAADAALHGLDIDAVSIQAVATAAGVSRATAFRHMGTREDMIVAVAMFRAARYARTCNDEMSRCTSVLGKIEAAFLYLARELPADQVMRAFFMLQTAADIDDEVRELAMATLGPVIVQGRANGVMRTDVSVEQVMSWIVEQLYLAIQQADRTEDAVQERVRTFLIPALTPKRGAMVPPDGWGYQLDAVSDALSHAAEAANVLRNRMLAATGDEEVK